MVSQYVLQYLLLLQDLIYHFQLTSVCVLVGHVTKVESIRDWK